MELIGKQIAIETILGQPPELHYPSWYARQIEDLPPAPPEYLAEQAGILVTDTDTISRAKAIDALRKMQTYKLFSGDDMLLIDQAGAQTELMLLPSAQPEKLTDIEQRIFLAAMSKEEKVCREVDKESSDADCINLMRVCKSIERKVKGALWT